MSYAYQSPAETGFIGAAIGLVGDVIKIASGQPQKEERKAKAQLEQAKIEQHTAMLQLAAQQQQTQQQKTSGPPLGIPWVAWLALAGGGAYLLTRRP